MAHLMEVLVIFVWLAMMKDGIFFTFTVNMENPLTVTPPGKK